MYFLHLSAAYNDLDWATDYEWGIYMSIAMWMTNYHAFIVKN